MNGRLRAVGRRFALLLSGLTWASSAAAHLRLEEPAPRHPADDLKAGPCGAGPADTRSSDPARITHFVPGQTISVRWTETVDHDPSHYRIALSRGGDQDFEDPTGYDDIRSGLPVLADGIPDAEAGPGQSYQVEVTLPDEPCPECTLQVIQVMHDKPPWGPAGGDDIYYQCADLVIDASAGDGGASAMAPDGVDEPPGSGSASARPPGLGGAEVEPSDGASGGCRCSPFAPGSAGWAPALFALVWLLTGLRRRTGPRA